MYDSIRPYNIAERRRIQKASALYETHLENILDLLSARGISEETARYHHLGYIDNDPIPGHEDYNQCITIPYMYPVWGRPAEIRKMRFRCSLPHDCKTHNHPKYLTPAGDTGSIYNMAAMANPAAEMHICEGEFDSMILEQCGWSAVAIPGATSWQNFWTKFFEGIEYPVETLLNDDTKIVGYIDRVFTDTNTGETFILDIKTGRLPADNMQLHTYRYMLAQQGIEVTKGMFWTPATTKGDEQSVEQGTATELIDIDNDTYRHVSSMYKQAMKGISQGIFVPHVTALCKGCPVRDACWAVNGKNSYRYPIETTVQPSETDHKEKDTK